MSSKTILYLENQFTHFDRFCTKFLKLQDFKGFEKLKECKVYDKNDNNYDKWKEIMKLTKVILNKQYKTLNSDYHKCAIKKFEEIVKNIDPMIVILDVHLGSSVECFNAFDFLRITEIENLFRCKPIIFISKKGLNEKDRDEDYNNFKSTWNNNSMNDDNTAVLINYLDKGYFGEGAYENEEHFKKKIMEKISAMLPLTEIQQLKNTIDDFLKTKLTVTTPEEPCKTKIEQFLTDIHKSTLDSDKIYSFLATPNNADLSVKKFWDELDKLK